jgi:hypothetical protein
MLYITLRNVVDSEEHVMSTGKFKAMVHYIVAACDPQRLGAVRLNKICWFTDTFTYRITGQSLSGETYVKRKHGPVPKSILATIRELEDEQKIHVRDHQILPTRKMRMFVALTDSPADAFSEPEREVLDYIISHVCNHHSANSISELSHDAIWDAANDGEEIPMWATLVSDPAELTPDVLKWARGVVKKVSVERNAA